MKVKNIRPIKRTRMWVKGPQRLSHKLSYFPALFVSYSNLALVKRMSVKYLGEKFSYDNYVTPLGLMLYPEEIDMILKHINQEPNSVLDVGANIGQFAVTFSKLSPHTKIYSFEPLPASFELLSKNTKNLPNISVYKLGIGKKGKQTLFYSPKRSVNASLIKGNENYILSSNEKSEVSIDLVEDIKAATGKKNFDLIKVDVEGYEYHTISSLKNVSAKYLYIEITSQGRQKDYLHSELFATIEKNLGRFDIIYITRVSPSKFEALLKFAKSKSK